MLSYHKAYSTRNVSALRLYRIRSYYRSLRTKLTLSARDAFAIALYSL